MPPTGRFLTVLTTLISPTSRGFFVYDLAARSCAEKTITGGAITLKSTNPFDSLIIDPEFYTTDFSIQTMVQAMKTVDEFVHEPRWDGYIIRPMEQFKNDQDMENYARNKTITIHHPVGTARMSGGSLTDGVVDSSLRVKGVKGLRAVDASIFPQILENHPQAVTYTIAERASDLIKSQQ
ncbi:hypothetical protein AAF712_004879 [Marasmius tenuissimus]|uniref:Glucose-methanol-choline oxidoreductase C-terminal domain-containing protein n=1 Tax=Marasmius tenuissimus TaxID=585030 RepID=A0ABR3A275_9AGAR